MYEEVIVNGQEIQTILEQLKIYYLLIHYKTSALRRFNSLLLLAPICTQSKIFISQNKFNFLRIKVFFGKSLTIRKYKIIDDVKACRNK